MFCGAAGWLLVSLLVDQGVRGSRRGGVLGAVFAAGRPGAWKTRLIFAFVIQARRTSMNVITFVPCLSAGTIGMSFRVHAETNPPGHTPKGRLSFVLEAGLLQRQQQSTPPLRPAVHAVPTRGGTHPKMAAGLPRFGIDDIPDVLMNSNIEALANKTDGDPSQTVCEVNRALARAL